MHDITQDIYIYIRAYVSCTVYEYERICIKYIHVLNCQLTLLLDVMICAVVAMLKPLLTSSYFVDILMMYEERIMIASCYETSLKS